MYTLFCNSGRLALRSMVPGTVLVLYIVVGVIAAGEDVAVDFERDVARLLIRRCIECHNSTDPSGALDLTSAAGTWRGGESGAVIDTQNADNSYLLQRVIDGEMPPELKGQSQKLPDDEIALIRSWVAVGATWPAERRLSLFEQTTDVRAGRDWWSLQPILKPHVPQREPSRQPENPIDAFVLAKLDQAGMAPAPPAEKRVIIRRLYYDLLGLPPTEREIEQYIQDDSSDAWERLIDSLLQRPQYGERWARYWLDLARYAETSGYERDQEKAFAWKYRDWVVNAFNNDMPYSQFIVEQIAGDEVEHRTEQSVIATGFLRLGSWNDEPNDPLDYQYDRLEDLVHTTSTAFLALTVKCARCHTHKFDPILQDDYYRIASVFWPGPIHARDSKLLGGPTAEELGFDSILGWTDLSPQPGPLQVLKKGERSQPMHAIVPASLSAIPSLEHEFEPATAESKTTQRRLQLAEWIADPRNPLTARVLVNRLWQHHFGNAIVRSPNNFGFLADPPTHPLLLDWLAAEFIERGGSIKAMHKLMLMSRAWRQSSLHPDASEYEQIDPANRLWWRAERRRSDAEALRDSMLAASGELDLRVGGEGFKPSVSDEALEGLSRKSAAWQASPREEQCRRSLYMHMKRGLLPPMMTAFDLCDATQPVGTRDVTTVPTQALVLLNNPFVLERSESLASRICSETDNVPEQIRYAWSSILLRQPTDRELGLASKQMAAQLARFRRPAEFVDEAVMDEAVMDESKAPAEVLALATLCQVLLNSNEFIYVD